MPQFTPRRSRPLCRETYQMAADNWARMCSQIDDYARKGNVRGITRILNRLHHSVRHLRDRHALDGSQAFAPPFDHRAYEARVAAAYDAGATITQEDYDGRRSRTKAR